MFIAKGYKTVVVAGNFKETETNDEYKDFWVEYYFNGIKYQKIVSATGEFQKFTLEPLYMFNDKMDWTNYDEDWANYA
jgi:hypothetical protein